MDLPRPVWITLTPNGNYITFSTYDQPPPYENTPDLLSTVNALNRTIDLVRFYIADGYLHGEYMLTYVGGLNAEQCVVAMRIFSRMFEIAFTHSSELRALV
jgi:hypothetical protein